MSRLLFTEKDERDEPIEYYNVFVNPPSNGLTVEEISWDEFLMAREEQAQAERRRKLSEHRSGEIGSNSDTGGGGGGDDFAGQDSARGVGGSNP